jgi:hypothetical protein
MSTRSMRALRLPLLAMSSLFLLAACGGGGGDGPGPVATNPDPGQPTQPTQPPPPPPPTQPPPPTNPPAAQEPVLATAYTDLVAGTINNTPGWSTWMEPAGRVPVSGVGCLGTVNFHKHSLVSIYKEGTRLGLPDNVGRGGCTYELHTHDVMGMVHMEGAAEKKYMLSQFFALWNQPLGVNGTAGLAGPVRFYLIDKEVLTRYTGDPAALELVPYREIVIISGAAPAVLPKYRWPTGL